jgi:hypothetical protein
VKKILQPLILISNKKNQSKRGYSKVALFV